MAMNIEQYDCKICAWLSSRTLLINSCDQIGLYLHIRDGSWSIIKSGLVKGVVRVLVPDA